MAKEKPITIEGIITEALPNVMFRVEIPNGAIILCTVCGKMRMHNIKLIEGDNVRIEMSPYDLTKGRITTRL